MHDLEQSDIAFKSARLPGKLLLGSAHDHTMALEAAIRHAVDRFIHVEAADGSVDKVHTAARPLMRFLNLLEAPAWVPGYDSSETPIIKGWVRLATPGTVRRITWQRVLVEFEPQPPTLGVIRWFSLLVPLRKVSSEHERPSHGLMLPNTTALARHPTSAGAK